MAQGSAQLSGNDHSLLSGLTDDDHSQYHNDTRHLAHHDFYCKVTDTTDQTINDVSNTVLEWNTEVSDDQNMHDNSTNNTRITIPAAGLYMMGYDLNLGTLLSPMTDWLTVFLVNGTNQWQGFNRTVAESSGSPSYNGTALIQLAQNDYVEVLTFQNSNGNQFTNSARCFFWVIRMSS